MISDPFVSLKDGTELKPRKNHRIFGVKFRSMVKFLYQLSLFGGVYMSWELNSRRNSHDYNYQRIIEFIFNHRQTSRSKIASALTLNKATVSLLCSEMQEQGLISEVGSGSAQSKGGRKPTLIEINKAYGYTLTIELDAQHIRALACYLDGETITFQQLTVANITSLSTALNHLISQFAALPNTNQGLLGICFAIHGIVNQNRVESSFLDLQDVDLVQLGAKYQVPVSLENEANLAAIYSRDFIPGNKLDNTVTLSIHEGIAAGLILDQRLYLGSQGRVGRIGQNIVVPAFPINNSRSMVTYQDVYSEDAITKQISELLAKPGLSLDDISKLYDDHNGEVITILSQFANGVSEILHNIAGLIDPDMFYINSPLLHQFPGLLAQIRKYFYRSSGYEIPTTLMPNVQLATLLGGAALTTHRYLHLEGVRLRFSDYINPALI